LDFSNFCVGFFRKAFFEDYFFLLSEVLEVFFKFSDFLGVLVFRGGGGGKAVVFFFEFIICGTKLVDFLLKVEEVVVGFLNEFFYYGKIIGEGSVGVSYFVRFVKVVFPINEGGEVIGIREGCFSLLGGCFIFEEIEGSWDGR
jgi:hypothetical protein